MTRHSKVFVPVSIDARKPINNTDAIAVTVPCLYENNFIGYATFFDDGFISYDKDIGKVTHWLEEKENVYVLTEDELRQLIISCINNPGLWKDYIKSKTNPQTENK